MKLTFLPGDVIELASANEFRTMTLEQYQKHARDPAFSAALAPADQAAVLAAIDAAAARVKG